MSPTQILVVEHLTMSFGGLVAVSDLSFDARRREITALIGPNGAGKTTLFNCITGFYRPTVGRLQLAHPDGASFMLERMPEFRLAREARVARTFQNVRLFPGMTLLENLLVAQHKALMLASGFTVLGLFGSRRYARAEANAIDKARYWLDRVGLAARADDAAGTLPYGAQRRLEIVRALCTDPVLLCLDEPAAGLNNNESAELNKFLRAVREEHGTSIFLIEHDMGVVMEISDRIVVLDHGRGGRAVSAAVSNTAISDPLLMLRGVKTYYGNVIALKGVDVDVHEGEIVALIGANGAGKSTLMMTVFGNPRASEGEIRFAGRDITAMATHEIAKLRIAQSPEGRRIFARMTVLENLQIGATVSGGGDFEGDLERVFTLFPRLRDRVRQRGGTLSGGEPSLGLAPLLVQQIFAAIRALNERDRLTVFLVEQNAYHALKLAHRGYVMVNGEITLTGNGRELLQRPEIRAAYLEGQTR